MIDAGDDLLSKMVNMAIQTKPLYAVMKTLAKKTIRDTAEGRGIPWQGIIQELTGQLEVIHCARLQLHTRHCRPPMSCQSDDASVRGMSSPDAFCRAEGAFRLTCHSLPAL